MANYIDKSDRYIGEVKSKFFSNIEEAAKTYSELLKVVLDTPPQRSGHVYKGLEGKEKHQAASPDPKKGGAPEPPAPLSRELINSIEVEKGDQTDTRAEMYIKSDAEYVLALEFGDPSNNLRPKPAWNKTLITFRNELGAIALDGFYKRGD